MFKYGFILWMQEFPFVAIVFFLSRTLALAKVRPSHAEVPFSGVRFYRMKGVGNTRRIRLWMTETINSTDQTSLMRHTDSVETGEKGRDS